MGVRMRLELGSLLSTELLSLEENMSILRSKRSDRQEVSSTDTVGELVFFCPWLMKFLLLK